MQKSDSQIEARKYFGDLTSDFLLLTSAELAMVAAVENVDAQSQRQPDQEAYPGDDSQSGHQSATQHDRNQREPGHHGNAEGARPVGLLAAQQNHTE